MSIIATAKRPSSRRAKGTSPARCSLQTGRVRRPVKRAPGGGRRSSRQRTTPGAARRSRGAAGGGGGGGRGAPELAYARNRRLSAELAVGARGEGRWVGIRPPVGIEHDGKVLAESQSARKQADAGVVAQAGGGDGEEIDGEDREVVRRFVGPAQDQRNAEHGAHQADVQQAAGEADPGAAPAAAGGGVDGERQPQPDGGGREQGDDVAPLLFLQQELAQREE